MSKLAVVIDDQLYEVEISCPPRKGTGKLDINVNGQPAIIDIPCLESKLEEWHWFEIDGKCFEIDLDPELLWIKSPTGLHAINVSDLKASAPFCPLSRDPRVKAPIPGLVREVFVEAGQEVKAGEPILILEAMKMENEIVSPIAGIVSILNAGAGKVVKLGDILAEIR